MKILYLTCLENIIDNGIYETQVKQLLFKLKKLYGNKINLTHLSAQPFAKLGKVGIASNLIGNKEKLKILKEDFRSNSVSIKLMYLPVILLKRWGSYLNIPLLLWFLSTFLPLLFVEIKRKKYDVVHCRSYLSTLSMILIKPFCKNLKIVFDVRGLYPEEGIVRGRWKYDSPTYKIWKRIEKRILLNSDISIGLSDTFVNYLNSIAPNGNYSLVYASVDLNKYSLKNELRSSLKKQLKLEKNIVFVYNGSLGAWHDPVLLGNLFKSIKKNCLNSKLLILTKFSKPKLIEILSNLQISKKDYTILDCNPHEMPKYLQIGDYGLVPLRENISNNGMKVIAETMIGLKVSEYLSCGLPIIVNGYIKGIRSLIEKFKIGVYFDIEKPIDLQKGINFMNNHYSRYRSDCLHVAKNYYNLDKAAFSYYKIYNQLNEGDARVGISR